LSLGTRIDFFFLSTEQKFAIASHVVENNSISWNQISYPLAVSIHLFVYALLIWNLLNKSDKELRIIPLLRQVARSFSIYVGVVLLYFVLYFSIDFNTIHDYMISSFAAFFIYQMGIIILPRPEEIHCFSIKGTASQKYHKAGGKESEAESYSDEVLQLIETEQIYLRHVLRIADIASILGISVNHLSQIINERLHKSFNELVNEYRVKKAMELLSDPENNDKMLTIAFMCGFNNKTSFNTIFKRHTQVSPMNFRNKVKSKVSA